MSLLNVNAQLSMPLRQAAQKRGIFIGASVQYPNLLEDETYRTIAGQQYDLTTPGNACKWEYIEPELNVYNFTECDYVFQYARNQNMTFRADPICWDFQNPKWLSNGNWTQSELETILQNYIKNVIGHYSAYYESKQFYCWDVVNEAISDDPTVQLYKNSTWYPAVPNYVNLAFQWAKKANSVVKLFYNDYNILLDSGWMKTKSDAVYNMIKNMTFNKIPIDGIGFQVHLSIEEYDYIMTGFKSIVSNFQRFADLGLEIHITEMDISCPNYTQTIETQQAEMYQQVLRACLAVDKCNNFETWGFTDKVTWKGTDEHPLPWDQYYNPKTAAFYILDELLNSTNNILQ